MTREPYFPRRWLLAYVASVGIFCALYTPVLAALVVAERIRK